MRADGAVSLYRCIGAVSAGRCIGCCIVLYPLYRLLYLCTHLCFAVSAVSLGLLYHCCIAIHHFCCIAGALGFMGDSSEGTFRKATGSVFPDCFIIGVSVQSSEGSQFSWKVGTVIIAIINQALFAVYWMGPTTCLRAWAHQAPSGLFRSVLIVSKLETVRKLCRF